MNTNLISCVIKTLNQITVSGKDNLDKLLGCISALEQIQEESNAQEEDTE